MSVSVGLCQSVSLSICRSRISKITHPNFTKFSVHVIHGRGSVLFWRRGIRCVLPFLWMTLFSHNGPYGEWHWQYLYECHAGASSQKLLRYAPGSATNFDFVVVHNSRKLRTRGVAACNMVKAGAKFAVYDCLDIIIIIIIIILCRIFSNKAINECKYC